jgi:hypothetical protein
MRSGFHGTAKKLPLSTMRMIAVARQKATLTAGPPMVVISCGQGRLGARTEASPPSGHISMS